MHQILQQAEAPVHKRTYSAAPTSKSGYCQPRVWHWSPATAWHKSHGEKTIRLRQAIVNRCNADQLAIHAVGKIKVTRYLRDIFRRWSPV